MAAAPSTFYHEVIDNAANWSNPTPDHTTLLTSVGGGTGPNQSAVVASLTGIAAHSPTVLCFMLNGDPDHIHVGYNPTLFPEDPTNTTPYDGKVMVLVGDDFTSATPIVLPATAFSNSASKPVTGT